MRDRDSRQFEYQFSPDITSACVFFPFFFFFHPRDIQRMELRTYAHPVETRISRLGKKRRVKQREEGGGIILFVLRL